MAKPPYACPAIMPAPYQLVFKALFFSELSLFLQQYQEQWQYSVMKKKCCWVREVLFYCYRKLIINTNIKANKHITKSMSHKHLHPNKLLTILNAFTKLLVLLVTAWNPLPEEINSSKAQTSLTANCAKDASWQHQLEIYDAASHLHSADLSL